MSKTKPGKNGRPSKLTPEITDRFLTAIKLGAPYELACNYAGIRYQTLQNWRERTEPEFIAFFEELTRAEGQAVVQWLATLEKHGAATGQWAAWKLERRYPSAFGRQDKLTIDVNKLDSEIDVELRRMALLATGSEVTSSGEAEGESVH